jgi:hypothetical protein
MCTGAVSERRSPCVANVLKAGAGGRSFNRAFVRKHPVATKRVVRAILKASTPEFEDQRHTSKSVNLDS